MKVLYAYGDNGYNALDFEDMNLDLKEVWNKAINSRHKEYEFKEGSWIQAFEFGEVDDKFIDFICDNFIDGICANEKNWYIVNE